MKEFIPKIQILKLIEEMEIIRPFDLVDYLGMTQKAAEMRVYRLQKAGLIEPLGPERGQWVLSVKGCNHLDFLERLKAEEERKQPARQIAREG